MTAGLGSIAEVAFALLGVHFLVWAVLLIWIMAVGVCWWARTLNSSISLTLSMCMSVCLSLSMGLSLSLSLSLSLCLRLRLSLSLSLGMRFRLSLLRTL